MTVGAMNANMNASYPKYLENKKNQGRTISGVSALLPATTGALYFAKSSIAVKHPVVMGILTALGLTGIALGINQEVSANKSLKKFEMLKNDAYQKVDSQADNTKEKPKMSEVEAKYIITTALNPSTAIWVAPKYKEAVEAMKYYNSQV